MGEITCHSSCSKHTITCIYRNFWISLSIIACLDWEQCWSQPDFSLTSDPASPSCISWSEVRDLQLNKNYFVCPAWNKFICFFEFWLKEETSNCRISVNCLTCCCCCCFRGCWRVVSALSIIDWSFTHLSYHALKMTFLYYSENISCWQLWSLSNGNLSL